MKIGQYDFSDTYNDGDGKNNEAINITNIVDKTGKDIAVIPQNPTENTANRTAESELVFFYENFAVLKLFNFQSKNQDEHITKDKILYIFSYSGTNLWIGLMCHQFFIVENETNTYTFPTEMDIDKSLHGKMALNPHLYFKNSNPLIVRHNSHLYYHWNNIDSFKGLPKEFTLIYELSGNINMYTNPPASVSAFLIL